MYNCTCAGTDTVVASIHAKINRDYQSYKFEHVTSVNHLSLNILKLPIVKSKEKEKQTKERIKNNIRHVLHVHWRFHVAVIVIATFFLAPFFFSITALTFGFINLNLIRSEYIFHHRSNLNSKFIDRITVRSIQNGLTTLEYNLEKNI